jgi:hypothetical protein
MAMRETRRSLKAYLLVAGILGFGSGILHLNNDPNNALTAALLFVDVLFAAAYFLVGINLDRLLVTPKAYVAYLFIAASVWLALVGVLGLLFGVPSLIVGSVIGLLITWYLSVNFKRLRGETMAPAST